MQRYDEKFYPVCKQKNSNSGTSGNLYPKKITVENNILRTVNVSVQENPEDAFDEWGEDLPEDVITECEMLATQIAEPEVDNVGNVSATSTNDLEKAKKDLEAARRQSFAKEGEISYLRGELNKKIMLLEQRNLEKIEALEKQKEKFKLEKENYERQIESYKTELQFNKQEVKNTLNKLAYIEKDRASRNTISSSQCSNTIETLSKRKISFPQASNFEAMEVCEKKIEVTDNVTQTCIPHPLDEFKKTLLIVSKLDCSLTPTIICFYKNEESEKLLADCIQTLIHLKNSNARESLTVFLGTLYQKLQEMSVNQITDKSTILLVLDVLIDLLDSFRMDHSILLPGLQCSTKLIQLFSGSEVQSRFASLQSLFEVALSDCNTIILDLLILFSELCRFASLFFCYNGNCLLSLALKNLKDDTPYHSLKVVSDLVKVMLFSCDFQSHCYSNDKFCDCFVLLMKKFCKLLHEYLREQDSFQGEPDDISPYLLLLTKVVHQENLMYKILYSCQVLLFEILSHLILIMEDPENHKIVLTESDISLARSLENVLMQLL